MLFLLKGCTLRLKLRALLKVTRVPGGARSGGAAGPRVTVKSCHPLSGHLTQGATCFLQGKVSWAGVGRAPPPRRRSSSAFCWEALMVLLQELETPASS